MMNLIPGKVTALKGLEADQLKKHLEASEHENLQVENMDLSRVNLDDKVFLAGSFYKVRFGHNICYLRAFMSTFRKCSMVGVHFSDKGQSMKEKSALAMSFINQCDLRYSVLPKNMMGVSIHKSDLSFASIANTNISEGKIDRCSIRGLDFTDANVDFCEFKKTSIPFKAFLQTDFSLAKMSLTNSIKRFLVGQYKKLLAISLEKQTVLESS